MVGPNIVVLSIDRLHAGYLGCYGNTWVTTPAIDRLASQSVVFDRATIDSPRLDFTTRSLWTAQHAIVHRRQIAEVGGTLLDALTKSGWHSTLITDDSSMAKHPLAAGFSERIEIPIDASSTTRAFALADDIESTDAARFYAEALAWLDRDAGRPFLLWLHTASLSRVWDAPIEFRSQFHDEEDPDAGDLANVPEMVLQGDVDPDEMLGIRSAYAGQIAMLDQMTGTLLDTVAQKPWYNDAIVMLLSPRGFPLGEHARIGPCDNALYAELTHVPCLLRLPKSYGASQRFTSLIQPADIGATLVDAVGQQQPVPSHPAGRGRSLLPLIRGEHAPPFDFAVAIDGDKQIRIETPAWAMRRSVSATSIPGAADSSLNGDRSADDLVEATDELFAKPDDWFEINEIASRCPDIVNQLGETLDAFQARCQAGEPLPAVDLPPELIEGE